MIIMKIKDMQIKDSFKPVENFILSPVSSLLKWRSQFSHFFSVEITQPGLPGSGALK